MRAVLSLILLATGFAFMTELATMHFEFSCRQLASRPDCACATPTVRAPPKERVLVCGRFRLSAIRVLLATGLVCTAELTAPLFELPSVCREQS